MNPISSPDLHTSPRGLETRYHTSSFPGPPAGLLISSRRSRLFDVTLSRSHDPARLFFATFLRVFQVKEIAETGMRTIDPTERMDRSRPFFPKTTVSWLQTIFNVHVIFDKEVKRIKNFGEIF